MQFNCKDSPCSAFSLGQLEFSQQLLGRVWELAQDGYRQCAGGHCSESNVICWMWGAPC